MKNVIIVGAGIAGLTAGVYARQSGFNTTIYEAHSIPGGASTSWRRKGYLFEGGMHWLTGSSDKKSLNKLWHETGALNDSTPIFIRDPFLIYEYGGKSVCLYRNIEKLETHLLELSPEDSDEIKRLCIDLKKLSKLDMPVSDIKGVKLNNKSSFKPSALFSMLPGMLRMPFYASQTAAEYAMRYKSPILQKLFMNIVGDENSATAVVFTLATLTSGDGGYPYGGSLAMANRIAAKFLDLGGSIQYNAPVDKIKVTNGNAAGIVAGGREIPADAVIVTQDTLKAVDTLFDNPIREPWTEKMKKETKPILNTFICLGIKADLSNIPESICWELDSPISCAGQKIQSISINNYSSYKDYAPEGCTALTSIILGDSYDWWKSKKQNGLYKEEKEKLAKAFIDAVIKKYPQLDGKVEVWDVATPLTYERYLHSYKGSWMSIIDKGSKMETYPAKPESINNLYFAGQRLKPPGGLPIAVETGRAAVQYLCKDTDTVFQCNI